MIVPDLNLAVYAHNPLDPLHVRAAEHWTELLNGEAAVGLSSFFLTGFVRIVTGPKFASGIALSDALAIATSWLEAPATRRIEPSLRHFEIVSHLLSRAGFGHNLVSDAYLAALAMEHGATIHSHDRDFARWPELKLHDPLA